MTSCIVDKRGEQCEYEYEFSLNFFVGVIAAWCANWYKHKTNSGIPLHYYFGITLSLQFIVSLLITIYFAVAPALALAVLADILRYSCPLFYSSPSFLLFSFLYSLPRSRCHVLLAIAVC